MSNLDHIVAGDAGRPALLLLHAGGMTRGEWEPFLEAWARHFYLIVPTAPGHGASPRTTRLTISGMADAVLALLDSLGVARTHVMGSSMGGAIALWIALTRPERVERMVIYRTSYRTGPTVHEGVLRMAQREPWEQWGLADWMAREHAPQGGDEAWLEVTRRVADAFDPATSDHLHDLGDLATLTQPTLLIGGDRDPVVPLQDMVDMYRTIPDAALWIVPNATHFMGAEGWRRESFVREIERFLRRA